MSNTTAKTARERGGAKGSMAGAIVDALVDEMQDATASVVDPEKMRALRETVMADMAEEAAKENSAALTSEEYSLLVYFFNRDKALKAEGYEAILAVRDVDGRIAPIEEQLFPLRAERAAAEERVRNVDIAIAQNAEQQSQYIHQIREKFGMDNNVNFSFSPEPPHYIHVEPEQDTVD